MRQIRCSLSIVISLCIGSGINRGEDIHVVVLCVFSEKKQFAQDSVGPEVATYSFKSGGGFSRYFGRPSYQEEAGKINIVNSF